MFTPLCIVTQISALYQVIIIIKSIRMYNL